jgi:hypothetical protein
MTNIRMAKTTTDLLSEAPIHHGYHGGAENQRLIAESRHGDAVAMPGASAEAAHPTTKLAAAPRPEFGNKGMIGSTHPGRSRTAVFIYAKSQRVERRIVAPGDCRQHGSHEETLGLGADAPR